MSNKSSSFDFVLTQLSYTLSSAKKNVWACEGLGKSKHEEHHSEYWQANLKKKPLLL